MTSEGVAVFGAGQTGVMAAMMLRHAGHRVVGYIDDDEQRWGESFDGSTVLGGKKFLEDGVGFDTVCVAAGQTDPRRAISQWCDRAGLRQTSAIHHTAIIPDEVEIGAGSIIGAGVVLYVNPAVGRNVFMGPGVIVSHDTTIGDYALLSVGATIGARVDIGEGAFVGAGATVMPPGWGQSARLSVGVDAIVGVGGVVISDVEDRAIVAGVPAKLLRHR